MANYNHQPFEEWLLSEETLAADDSRRLHEHLQSCAACRRLAEALRAVDLELRSAPALEPAPGFVSRWQERMAADRRLKHRRQTFWIMLWVIGGAMGLLTVLAALFYPLLRSPMPILLAYVYELTSTFAFASTLGEAGWTVLRTIIGIVPPTQWAAIWVALASLGAVWVVAMGRLTSTRRLIV